MNKKIILSVALLGTIASFLTYSIALSVFERREKANNEIFYQQMLAGKIAAENKEQKIYLIGKFDQTQREDFTLIPVNYTTNGTAMYLRKETMNAFLDMETKAQQDGIMLRIASATRNFEYQKGLWNNKWSGVRIVEGKNLSVSLPNGYERFKKILEYSAAPGTSRHHWGTDIDINAATPEYFETVTGQKVYEWLTANAPAFGFCQVYDLKDSDRPFGYHEEKWHWSYLPLARDFTKNYMRLIEEKDITGFMGDEYVPASLINEYVLGINPECI